MSDSNIVPLLTQQGSLLCTLSLYRLPDGSIRTHLLDMPVHVIEAEDTIAARFEKMAGWLSEGAEDCKRQATKFEEQP